MKPIRRTVARRAGIVPATGAAGSLALLSAAAGAAGSTARAPHLLPSSLGPGVQDLGLGNPAVPAWLIAPCSSYGLGGRVWRRW